VGRVCEAVQQKITKSLEALVTGSVFVNLVSSTEMMKRKEKAALSTSSISLHNHNENLVN
jgi:predicted solute-binding protein